MSSEAEHDQTAAMLATLFERAGTAEITVGEDACVVLVLSMDAADWERLRARSPALGEFLTELHHRIERRESVWA